MKKPPPMVIDHPTASHLPALEAELADLPAGAIVIEHGAGLYSTPAFARTNATVLCIESHEGWAGWALWMHRYNDSSVVPAIPWHRIKDAALVFIDGHADERGPLLSACLEAGVPTIIAHDTGIKTRDYYGYKPHHFMVTRYEITNPVERTTVWKLKPPMGVPFDP
jgi:hypothetical protein